MNFKIGDEVTVHDAAGNIISAISEITDTKNINGKNVYCCDNVWYSEEQLSVVKYQLTPGAVLALWLRKHGYVNEDNIWEKDGRQYGEEFTDLMNDMAKIGAVVYKEEDGE